MSISYSGTAISPQLWDAPASTPVSGTADAGALPMRERQHVAAGPQRALRLVHVHEAALQRRRVLLQEIPKAATPCATKFVNNNATVLPVEGFGLSCKGLVMF